MNRRLEPDLIILESMNDGWALRQQVQDLGRVGIPLVVGTGAGRALWRAADRLAECGVAVITKPFDSDEPRGVVTRSLAAGGRRECQLA